MSNSRYRDEYLEAAIEDLIEIQGFYDAQVIGLGTEFAEAVSRRIDLLLEFPEAAAVFTEQQGRRVKIDGFPYQVMYRVGRQVVYIVAVVHQKRHPKYWLSRFKTFE